ncbi:nuclear transport factor 2 family protein [Virgibacillus sp. NKC19-3]|uniref:nuclear transport factor 2 family protein n=1 Tax=Virgibacillus saliphilus TaxID=2831674 RepID=UPI001C9B5F44|nr:nuclear transport factor 2 family protein [Virgibacillus sp. NKC19-3]MBY7142758.1 nuclear transport factor 2 family protein [Virgibacillus sp. NKC19-3]
MDREQAIEFLSRMYQEIIVDMKIEKIPDYFSKQYIQTTDGVSTDIAEFTSHVQALKGIVNSISISPFYDVLFDDDKQTATLRYTVTANKKGGKTGEIEVIAIFELDNDKIVRCNEQSCPLNQKEEFKDLASVNY